MNSSKAVSVSTFPVFVDGAGMEWSSYDEILEALQDAIYSKSFERIDFLNATLDEWLEAELQFIHGIQLPASDITAIRLCSSVVPTGTLLNSIQ